MLTSILSLLAFGAASPAAAAPCGHPGAVLSVADRVARLCVGSRHPTRPGEVLVVRRLEPVPGPSKLNHHHWRKVAKLRIERVADGVADAREIQGRVRAYDRADLSHGW